jgi:hypothetical protein
MLRPSVVTVIIEAPQPSFPVKSFPHSSHENNTSHLQMSSIMNFQTFLSRHEVQSETRIVVGNNLKVSHRRNVLTTTFLVLPISKPQFRAVHRFVTMAYECKHHNSANYPSSCRLFQTRWIKFVPHRKHVSSTSPTG